MPRPGGISVQHNFTKGLVTTASPLNFPENACTDIDNCVLTLAGSINRRTAIANEATGGYTNITGTQSSFAYSDYIWNAVAGNGELSFYVVQYADTIYFYDISTSTNVGTNKLSFTINLTTYKSNALVSDPGLYACQFAYGDGNLFIVNPSINPIYVTYIVATASITVTPITIQIRDLWGLNDGLGVTQRVSTNNLTTLNTNNPAHYYNLYNQGWGLTNALTLWIGARSDTPSDADFTALYRSSPTIAFTNTYVGSQCVSNVPAAKGHYIMPAFDMDRSAALQAEGFMSIPAIGTYNVIPAQSLTIIGNVTISGVNANLPAGISIVDWIGYDLGAGNAQAILSVIVNIEIPLGNSTVTLYASNTAPTSATNGTSLGTQSITSSGFNGIIPVWTVSIVPSDTTTQYRYWWIAYSCGTSHTSATINCAASQSGGPIDLFTGSVGGYGTVDINTVITNNRPSCVAFYDGRVWYGGVQGQNTSTNIYFSRIALDHTQYGMCYQLNDPCSETVPDLLTDDGGIIHIPDMGQLQRLFQFQTALIAFASNGIWLISGDGSNVGFKATDYLVRKVSSIGMTAPFSVVDFQGTPLWWGEDGIYQMQYNPNWNSFQVQNMTMERLQEYYNSIHQSNLPYVKGTYNQVDKNIYWVYNDDVGTTDPWSYDRALVYNGYLDAFHPWTFSTDITNNNQVRGVQYTVDAAFNSPPIIKFLTTQNSTGGTFNLLFSDTTDPSGTYEDWGSFTYSSYFKTNYKLDGQTQKLFQPNYVFVFLNQQSNEQAIIQAIYDFTTDPSAGKYSTKQFLYNTNMDTRRTVNYRRMKVRGIGRVLQLFIQSYQNYPFQVWGWSLDESANPSV